MVQMARGAPNVELLARSADEYIHRWANTGSLSLVANGCVNLHVLAFSFLNIFFHITRSFPCRWRIAGVRNGKLNEVQGGSTAHVPLRALCEEDAAAGPGSVSEAAGEAGRGIYEGGAYLSSGLPSTDAYLTRRAGMFPDIVERLAMDHLARGDQLSALITAEWCGRPPCFGRLGRLTYPPIASKIRCCVCQSMPSCIW